MFEIGSALREARVRRKVTLQQAEDDTKIRVKYIQAMENEDFDVMPSTAYVMGFLRTYSVYLGLDADVMLEEYRARFEPSEEHDAFGGSSALRPRHARRRNTLAFVAVVCGLILVLLYVLGLNSHHDNKPVVVVSPTPSPSLSRSVKPTPKPSPTLVGLTVTADQGAVSVAVHRGSPSGKQVFSAILSQGQSRSFHLASPLALTIEQPSLVLVSVNGKKAVRPTETATTTYRITPKGMTVYQGAP